MSLQSIMTLFSLISGLSMYALSLKYLGENGEVEVVCLCQNWVHVAGSHFEWQKQWHLAPWHDQNNGVCLFLTT